MAPNPYLRRLGLADTDRAVVIHADDIGVSQASVAAFMELLDFGLVSSGAAMVPCAWFPTVAAYARRVPQADIGVHLTLTSEWDMARWGPVSTRDPTSGLVDGAGYFYTTRRQVEEAADLDAVRLEVRTQVARAVAAGIDVTHVDTHMFTLMHWKFLGAYRQVAREYRVPLFMTPLRPDSVRERGMDAATVEALARMIVDRTAAGLPTFDHVDLLPLSQSDNRLALTKARLAAVPPGLTHFIIHPSLDTPEARALSPDWPSRVADYETFMSRELCDFVRDQGLQVIGYRALRDAMRRPSVSPIE